MLTFITTVNYQCTEQEEQLQILLGLWTLVADKNNFYLFTMRSFKPNSMEEGSLQRLPFLYFQIC